MSVGTWESTLLRQLDHFRTGDVVVQALAFLVARDGWVLVPLAYGFLARVASGPRFSPLGLLVTRWIVPRVRSAPRLVPGPPKRFAQAIGLAFSGGAGLAWVLGVPEVSYLLIAGLLIAATLESVVAVCLGCIAYRFLWECDDCDDINERLRSALAARERAAATN